MKQKYFQIKVVVLSLGMFAFTSCNDFLDREPLDKITPEERKQLMTEAVNRQPAGE